MIEETFDTELNNTDKEAINKIIRTLLKNSYIRPTKLNINKMIEEPNKIYNDCLKYEDAIRKFFSVLDIDLIKTSTDGTYYLSGEKIRPIQPSVEIIKFILILRNIYNEKFIKLNSKEMYFTKKELREKGAIMGLFPGKITEETWQKALSFLKQNTLITFQGAISDLEDTDKIYIYPTISIYMSQRILNQVTDAMMQSSDVLSVVETPVEPQEEMEEAEE